MVIIQGHVNDEVSGRPLQDVEIVVELVKKPDSVIHIKMMMLMVLPKKTRTTYRKKTNRDGFYSIKIPLKHFRLTVAKDGYKTVFIEKTITKENVIQIDASLNRLNLGKLEGQILVNNLHDVTLKPQRKMEIEILQGKKLVAGTDVNATGKYFVLLPQGDYSLSIKNPEKHFLIPTSVNVHVLTKKDQTHTTTKDISVEMISVPKSKLGLKKKKHRIWDRKNGPVNSGYCVLGRVNPKNPKEIEIIHSIQSPKKNRGYGWFQFDKLPPGIYAVTFYKHYSPEDLKKYSRYFTITKSVLKQHQKTPFAIGKDNGKDVLQRYWNDLEEVKDTFDTIAGMAEKLKDILTPFGIKISS